MRTIRTPKKRAAILEVIAAGGTVAEAARHGGIARSAVFSWRAADAAFAADFEEAYANGTDVYEAEARRRAFDQSDSLLIFLLKARDPQRFVRKLIAVGGDPNAPPIGVAVSNIHFYMPMNGRDRPADIDADTQSVVAIEGKAAEDAA